MNMDANTPELIGASCRLTATAVAIVEKGIMIQILTTTGDAGKAEKASAAANKRVVGVNEAVCGASGFIVARSGIFGFDNSQSQPVTAGMVGAPCYVEDEHTVAAVASNSNLAGKVVEVTSTCVYVKVGI
jgi:hypothetical protein